MKAFKFRLARVQRAYEINEELARAQWLAAAQRTTDCKTDLQRMEQEYRDSQDQLGAGIQSGGISPQAAVLAHRTMDEQERRIKISLERVQTLAFQEEQLREPWQARRQEVRGLEQLHTRSKGRYVVEEMRRESKELDEIASTRAGRAMNEQLHSSASTTAADDDAAELHTAHSSPPGPHPAQSPAQPNA